MSCYSNTPVEANVIFDVEYMLREAAQSLVNNGVYDYAEDIKALMAKALELKKIAEIARAKETIEKVRRSLAVLEIVERSKA